MKDWEKVDAERDELRRELHNPPVVKRLWEYIYVCEKEISELKFELRKEKFKLRKEKCDCEACQVRRGDFN